MNMAMATKFPPSRILVVAALGIACGHPLTGSAGPLPAQSLAPSAHPPLVLTGHDGSMTTIHSNSPRDALSRLETMVLMAGVDLPSRAIREQISSAIQILVHVRRYEDGVRRIETIAEMTGMEGSTPLLQDIFTFRRRGAQGRRRLTGDFAATGIVPHVVEELRGRGIDISLDWFQKRSSDG